ncbi:MarR family transcriptional regulator [Paenibacillus oryzae]|uniref:MarR family transcriptional regulator n=1 Tax=Paenibacillus oryzae TaxID=1844972 RepID=A0A1A5YA06_9BACL|nr:MarR family transcriptional regulator [Paenibacillus oryzae]OBR62454.1 MarR family transcriptional regulator [Paenibacillus oryzae]
MGKSALFYRMVTFVAAVHRIQVELGKDINLDGMTPVQYAILEYIAVDQPVTLSGISECLGMSMPNASRELRKLAEMGLCSKYTDEVDRRKQHITLSSAGEERMKSIFAQMESRLMNRMGEISPSEMEAIVNAMDTLQSLVFNDGSK